MIKRKKSKITKIKDNGENFYRSSGKRKNIMGAL
jgi:hypothetical protein